MTNDRVTAAFSFQSSGCITPIRTMASLETGGLQASRVGASPGTSSSAKQLTLKLVTLHLPLGSRCLFRHLVQQKWPEQVLQTLPAAHVTYALILCPRLPWGLVQAAPKIQRMRPAGKCRKAE